MRHTHGLLHRQSAVPPPSSDVKTSSGALVKTSSGTQVTVG